MSAQQKQKAGKSLMYNRVEERPVASLDMEQNENYTQKYGHQGLLAMDLEAKMEDTTTMMASFVQPKGPEVRLRGPRTEYLEKQIAQSIRERIEREKTPAPCKPEYCSVTKKDFTVEGFTPLRAPTTSMHDYKSEDAITFWSENYHQIQGVTPVRSARAPFRKCSQFSRPIGERLDELDPPSL